MREPNVHYTDVHPQGRCIHCKGRAVKVTQGPHAGKFVWRSTRDRFNHEGWEHVVCSAQKHRPITADYDHYAEVAGTSRKPAQP